MSLIWPSEDRPESDKDCKILYKSDWLADPNMDDFDRPWSLETGEIVPWTPSIHMPRWASRIQLRITDVRVERVQDISIDDIEAEGITHPLDGPHANQYWREEMGNDFAKLWDSINAKRGYGWDSNPWVWVIEFERIAP